MSGLKVSSLSLLLLGWGEGKGGVENDARMIVEQ